MSELFKPNKTQALISNYNSSRLLTSQLGLHGASNVSELSVLKHQEILLFSHLSQALHGVIVPVFQRVDMGLDAANELT